MSQHDAGAALALGDAAAWEAGIQVTVDIGVLVGGEQPVNVGGQALDRALTVAHHQLDTSHTQRTAYFATGTGLPSSCFFVSAWKSSRRPREMRDITVPMGTSSIFAISA